MLTIRKAQMDVLNSVMRERFIDKTLAHVREVFPEQTAKTPDAELRALSREGLARAEKYQITDGREVMLFIDLMVGFGKDFETLRNHAWMKRVLQNPDLAQRQKMDLIYKRLR